MTPAARTVVPDTRHFGLVWAFYVVDNGRYDDEFEWRTPSDDGEFLVIYANRAFGLMEFGGRGPGIWDLDHGIYESPLAAMYAARKIHNERSEEWKRYAKEMDRAYDETPDRFIPIQPKEPT